MTLTRSDGHGGDHRHAARLGQDLFKAAQRGLGTLVGVATTTAVIEVVNSGPLIVVIVLIATFAAIVFYRRTT